MKRLPFAYSRLRISDRRSTNWVANSGDSSSHRAICAEGFPLTVAFKSYESGVQLSGLRLQLNEEAVGPGPGTNRSANDIREVQLRLCEHSERFPECARRIWQLKSERSSVPSRRALNAGSHGGVGRQEEARVVVKVILHVLEDNVRAISLRRETTGNTSVCLQCTVFHPADRTCGILRNERSKMWISLEQPSALLKGDRMRSYDAQFIERRSLGSDQTLANDEHTGRRDAQISLVEQFETAANGAINAVLNRQTCSLNVAFFNRCYGPFECREAHDVAFGQEKKSSFFAESAWLALVGHF